MTKKQQFRYKIRFMEDGVAERTCQLISDLSEDEMRSLINYDAEIVSVVPYLGKIN